MGYNFSTGNFVADATVHTNLKHPDSKAWADCSIALINSGGIKASIKPGKQQTETGISKRLTGQSLWGCDDGGTLTLTYILV